MRPKTRHQRRPSYGAPGRRRRGRCHSHRRASAGGWRRVKTVNNRESPSSIPGGLGDLAAQHALGGGLTLGGICVGGAKNTPRSYAGAGEDHGGCPDAFTRTSSGRHGRHGRVDRACILLVGDRGSSTATTRLERARSAAFNLHKPRPVRGRRHPQPRCCRRRPSLPSRWRTLVCRRFF